MQIKKWKHSCAGSIMPGGTVLPCICVHCVHDTADCCMDKNLECPEFCDGEQICPDFEREESDDV